MIELKIIAATAGELVDQLVPLAELAKSLSTPAARPAAPAADEAPAPVVAQDPAPVAAEPAKRGRKPKEAAPAAEPVAETPVVEETPAPVPTPTPAANGKPLDIDDIKTLAEQVHAKHGIVELRKLFASVGAERLSAIPVEKYPQFAAEAHAALAR